MHCTRVVSTQIPGVYLCRTDVHSLVFDSVRNQGRSVGSWVRLVTPRTRIQRSLKEVMVGASRGPAQSGAVEGQTEEA